MSQKPVINKEFVEAVSRFGRAYRQHMGRHVFPALTRFARQVNAAMWKSYRQAGMPYGESEEGMRRWMMERADEARTRIDADRRAVLEMPLFRDGGTAR